MIVLVLTAAPAGLRGDLTKWLLEVNPGVFVGNPSTRIRDELWTRTTVEVKEGRALLIYSSDSEQRLRFKVHKHHWKPVDLDGLTLIKRPVSGETNRDRRTGWSAARGMQRSKRPAWRRQYEQTDPPDTV